MQPNSKIIKYVTDINNYEVDQISEQSNFELTDIFYQEDSIGEFQKYLKLPIKSKIKKAILKVVSIRHKGPITPRSPGISTTFIYSDNSSIQFVVDFHGFRNIYGISKKVGSESVNEVKQWGGINFIDKDITESKHIYGDYILFSEVKTEKILVIFKHNSISHEDFKNNFQILTISYPFNVTFSLGNESPIWSYPGELARSVTIPDFSKKLCDYINTCKSTDGYCTIPLTFRSDSPGNLKITENIDYYLIWEYDTYTIDFDGIETKEYLLEIILNNFLKQKMPLKQLKGGVKQSVDQKNHRGNEDSNIKIQLFAISFTYKGNFSNEFVDDYWINVEKKVSVKILTGMTIGLRIQPFNSLKSSSIDLYLIKKSKDATLFAEIVEDQDEKPSEKNILYSKSVNLSDKSLGEGEWVTIKIDETVSLDKEKNYWLILKGGRGEVEWFCSTSEDPERPNGYIFRKESSNQWISYPVTGYFRLKYQEELKDISPITIKIVDVFSDQILLDLKPAMEHQTTSTINFPKNKIFHVEDSIARIKLVITSKTSGKLTLSNMVVRGKVRP